MEENLEFPCEATSLYDHWNPLNVDPASSPRSYHGTPDQYEMGDLSGKFGTLDNYTAYEDYYNDTMLPLFGPRSIVGRSIVIHKKVNEKFNTNPFSAVDNFTERQSSLGLHNNRTRLQSFRSKRNQSNRFVPSPRWLRLRIHENGNFFCKSKFDLGLVFRLTLETTYLQ